MIDLVLIIGIIGFALAILFNIFFTYIPIAKIKTDIDEATDKVNQTVNNISDIEDKIEGIEEDILPKVKNDICAYCQNTSSITTKILCVELNKAFNLGCFN